MPQQARRNSIYLLVALAALLAGTLTWFHFRWQLPASARWIMSAWIAAAVGWTVTGAVRFYVAHKRGKGHPLNGITRADAIASLIVASVYVVALLTFVFRLPRGIWIGFLFTSSFAGWLMAFYSVLRLPWLLKTPTFELDRITEAIEQLVSDAPEPDRRLTDVLDFLNEYKRQVRGEQAQGEGN